MDMLCALAGGFVRTSTYIAYRLVGREINMLKNVKSLTFRLFTDKEEAENHCNVGNGQLVLDEICSWIERI